MSFRTFLFTIKLCALLAITVGLGNGVSPGVVEGALPGANGKIAFSSVRDGNAEVYVMNADGSAQTRLTNDAGFDFRPAWSPDGTQIAFETNRDGNTEIYVMNADGSGVANLTNNGAADFGATWSPDGAKIAFASNRDGNGEIYVMDAGGGGQTRLTFEALDDFDPSWSPDGTQIAFVTSRDTVDEEIFVMNADGSSQTALTNNVDVDIDPDWSPDGLKIAFESERGDSEGVFVMNDDGSGQTNVSGGGAPAWSPDGTKIAFSDGEIRVMNPDGSGQTNVTNNVANDTQPAWQPVLSEPLPFSLLRTLDTPNPQVSSFVGYFDSLALGDADGDGLADVAFGASGETVGGNTSQGRVYVRSGADGALLHTLDTPSPQAGAQFGWSLAMGDVVGDGRADIAAGAIGWNSAQGLVSVFSGAGGGLLNTLTSPNGQNFANFGWVLAMGDADGDGRDDIAVSAPFRDLGFADQGRVYVFSGASGALLHTLDSPNPQVSAFFGYTLAMGDADGDGRADIAVGTPFDDVGPNFNQGRVYLFSGASGALLDTLDSPIPQASAQFGRGLAMGDADGDGRADIAVGAPFDAVGANFNQGRAYLFSGATGALIRTLNTPNPQGSVFFGFELAMGDVDGDGQADIAVDAIGETLGGPGVGRAYLFSGASGALLDTIDPPNPNTFANFGYSIAMAGVDIAVAAPFEQVGATGDQGRAYLFSLDNDRDAVLNAADNCPATANGPGEAAVLGVGNQTDSDGDGVPGTQPPPGGTFGGDACDSDDDNDGIPDVSDGCRTLAEDFDGFQDADGCPDTDNDKDGVLDVNDLCPTHVEDKDSYKDTDGCPDPDNDEDGFKDHADDCPGTDFTAGPDGIADNGDEPLNELGVPIQTKEDYDGVIDTDGCHDSPGDDYDGDGLSDEDEVFIYGSDPVDPDTDKDGCLDGVEVGPSETVGGQRDPTYHFDFMDMWVNKQKDQVVNIIDVGAIVQRFFTAGDPGGNPLNPPQDLTSYHVSADRSPPIGPNVWNAGPPDGTIDIIEIGLVVVQFLAQL